MDWDRGPALGSGTLLSTHLFPRIYFSTVNTFFSSNLFDTPALSCQSSSSSEWYSWAYIVSSSWLRLSTTQKGEHKTALVGPKLKKKNWSIFEPRLFSEFCSSFDQDSKCVPSHLFGLSHGSKMKRKTDQTVICLIISSFSNVFTLNWQFKTKLNS